VDHISHICQLRIVNQCIEHHKYNRTLFHSLYMCHHSDMDLDDKLLVLHSLFSHHNVVLCNQVGNYTGMNHQQPSRSLHYYMDYFDKDLRSLLALVLDNIVLRIHLYKYIYIHQRYQLDMLLHFHTNYSYMDLDGSPAFSRIFVYHHLRNQGDTHNVR